MSFYIRQKSIFTKNINSRLNKNSTDTSRSEGGGSCLFLWTFIFGCCFFLLSMLGFYFNEKVTWQFISSLFITSLVAFRDVKSRNCIWMRMLRLQQNVPLVWQVSSFHDSAAFKGGWCLQSLAEDFFQHYLLKNHKRMKLRLLYSTYIHMYNHATIT